MSSMTLFAVGGAGINIGKQFYTPEISKEPGFAPMKVVFIDTSKSNIPEGVSNFIHIKDPTGVLTKGSGKVRSTNYEAAMLQLDHIVKEAKPTDINVFIHSASGGSGSILTPLLVSSFLSKGKNAVVLMVGSKTCRQEIINTINTIKTYQSIAQTRNKPVLVYYLENGNATMAENDASIKLVSVLLSAIWSDENHGLDEQDLHNFINYHNVSNYKPALSALEIYTHGEPVKQLKGQAVSSVLTMVRAEEDPDPGMTVGYHSYGILSQPASEGLKMKTPIHLHTVQGYFAGVLNELQAKLDEIDAFDRTNVINVVDVSGTKAEDNGIIL